MGDGGAAAHHAAAGASVEPMRVLALQELVPQEQPLQDAQPAGAAAVAAATPAQPPQVAPSALAPSTDDLGRIAAAAAAWPQGAIAAGDLALWQQVCQMAL